MLLWFFFIGNYIFFRAIDFDYKFNWSLFNFIFFIVIVFIPYNDIKINLLGVTEGDAKKRAYEDYELMFPTDYEKQNPLTKKKAMIKYFKKLEKMSLIDKYQSNYLINNTNKESFMENYYKTSKNIGNILNSYEFQRQFIKSKKKYKFMKKIKERKILLENEKPNEFKNFTENINNNLNYNNLGSINNSLQTLKAKKAFTYNNNHKKSMMSVIKEEENSNYNNDFDISTIIKKEKTKTLKRENTSKYMRKTLFQQIKNEGLYDDSEEEMEDDSLDSENEDTRNLSQTTKNSRHKSYNIIFSNNEEKTIKFNFQNNL